MTVAIAEYAGLLRRWIGKRLSAGSLEWFERQTAALKDRTNDKPLYLALGYAPRRLGKQDLALSHDEFAEAQAARPGWDPRDWSIDQAARLFFLLQSYNGDEKTFKNQLEQLFRTADIGELIAFYRGLPLFPAPGMHVARAREGARSAMQPIFEAVAHRNPYPREQFDENAWNHMVLKALFIGSRLDPIQGLDERANPALTRMLCDYAHERWAAGRSITPELWRCVGPFAGAAALADLERVLETGDALERQAAALALRQCPAPGAQDLLRKWSSALTGMPSMPTDWSALSALAR